MLGILPKGIPRGLFITRHLSQDARNIVQNTKVKGITIDEVSSNLSKGKSSTHSRTRNNSVGTPSWHDLNAILNSNYATPTITELNSANHFFNSADIKYEWSVGKFIDVPGEKLREKQDSQNTLSPGIRTTSKRIPGKTYVPFELVNGLPEVTFLGKSNAGKSTLLNNLTTDLKNNSLNAFAKASRKAGFTKTLNSFNIGNRIRLVDTPGYGYKSSLEQGDVTMQYLLNRRELVRTFLLISGEQGIGDLDLQVIEFMHQNGIPFEVVFTKMDKVIDAKKFQQDLEASGLLNLPTMPRLVLTNSVFSKSSSKRYGIDLLRFIILQSCGLRAGTTPSRKKKK